MTSINALRFDNYSGICIGDESISTVAGMRVNLGEKISPVIPPVIVENYGTVAMMGTTGTCSTGDTIKETFENRVMELYKKEVDKQGKKPDKFISVEEMMEMVFDIVVEVKLTQMNEKLKGTYGFDGFDFISGKYSKNGKTFEIKDKDVTREIIDYMTWKSKSDDVGYIYLNAGLFAGYDDQSGFQIYHFDQREGYWHRVQNCYMAEGSGRHSVDPTLYGYAEKWLLEQRRGNIDPVEGSIALISGVNSASDHEIGVGGYYNIILMDGRKPHNQRLWEVNDDRSLLANHIVRALDNGFLPYQEAHTLIKGLLFEFADFNDIYTALWDKVKNPHTFSQFLRGYKLVSKKLL